MTALTAETIESIRDLRYRKGLTVNEITAKLGVGHSSVAVHAPRADLVDVAPLRKAFQRSDLIGADVARALGWIDSRGKADSPRVHRALGLRADVTRGRRVTRERIAYDLAVKLAAAMDVDPVDVGI